MPHPRCWNDLAGTSTQYERGWGGFGGRFGSFRGRRCAPGCGSKPRRRSPPAGRLWLAGSGAPGSLVGTLRRVRGEVGGVRAIETILFLVVVGTVVAAFAGRLRVPAPSLLG